MTKLRIASDLSKVVINARDEAGQLVLEREPLGNLLVYEVDYNDSSFLRCDKRWYKIFDDFKQHIDNEVQKIPILGSLMPAWDASILADPKGEAQYNEYVANQKGWKNLDRQLISVDGSTRVEVCDLYDQNEMRYIHVKRVWGSKTAYLLSQGLISAESNYHWAGFRKKCCETWPGLFTEDFARGRHVVFAIADEKSTAPEFPTNLSYFAKLNLAQTASRLSGFGYQIFLAPVKVIDGSPRGAGGASASSGAERAVVGSSALGTGAEL